MFDSLCSGRILIFYCKDGCGPSTPQILMWFLLLLAPLGLSTACALASDCQPHLAATRGKQALAVNSALLESGGYRIFEGKAFAYLLWTGNLLPLFLEKASIIVSSFTGHSTHGPQSFDSIESPYQPRIQTFPTNTPLFLLLWGCFV